MFNVVKILFCFVFDIIKVVLLKLEIFEFRVVSHSCIGTSSSFCLVWIFPHVELRCHQDMSASCNFVDHMGIKTEFRGPYAAQGC